jgi:hypothetical protein
VEPPFLIAAYAARVRITMTVQFRIMYIMSISLAVILGTAFAAKLLTLRSSKHETNMEV